MLRRELDQTKLRGKRVESTIQLPQGKKGYTLGLFQEFSQHMFIKPRQHTPTENQYVLKKWKTTLEMIKPQNNSRPWYPPHNISPLRRNKTGVVCSMCRLPTHIFANKEWECIMSQTCIQRAALTLLTLSGDAATSHSSSPEKNTLATQVCCES